MLNSWACLRLVWAALPGLALICTGPASHGQTLFPFSNQWRFSLAESNVPANWNQTNYDDSLWPQGAGVFYSRNLSIPAPQNTLLPLTNTLGAPIRTYYFRTHFSLAGSTAGLYLVVTNYLQAGAVFYLNGVELDRVRLPSGTTTAATEGFTGPETDPLVLLLPAPSLRTGDNVFCVEVHRAGAPDGDILFGASLTATAQPPQLPDLVIWGPSISAHFEIRSFSSNDCEVLEGCGTPGVRTLLRFPTETRNTGTADLVLGDPTHNPLFVFDSCHGHYHFEGYVDFKLLDTNDVPVAVGRKIGFALVDGERWDTTNGNPSDRFDSYYQGIQHGWSDLYDYLLPCQGVDITGLPPGLYTMQFEVDPDHKLPELNETNNLTRVPVVIPQAPGVCSGPPANDAFANAQTMPGAVSSAIANNDCASREPGEPNIWGNPGGRSIWFRWTAPGNGTVTIDTEGSDFDTILGLYTGTNVAGLTTIAGDDDAGSGRTSRIITNAVGGTVYSIAVDGYAFLSFGRAYSGNVVLHVNWRPALRLVAPAADSGAFRFTLQGTAGDRCVIETSTNFSAWAPWLHVTNQTGSLNLTAPMEPGGRFYRARLE